MRDRAKRRFCECPANRAQCRLRASIPAGDAEIPILNVVTAAVPFVRPAEYECAGAPCVEGRSDLPLQGPGLRVLAVPAAVEPYLPHQEWPVARNIVQTRQVRFETLS